MRKLTRRTFVSSAAAVSSCLLLRPYGAAAARTLTLRYANNLPPAHPLNVRAAEAAARIATETNGEVGVSLFPDNRFGGDSEMLELVRVGGIDIFTPSGLVLSAMIPAAQINAVGFAFSDYAQIWNAMDGDLGAFIRRAVEQGGLHMLRMAWDNGFRQCTASSRPVAGPDDFAGLRIRVPVSRLPISLFSALGAAPSGLQYSELYDALKTGVFEAQENPLSIILSARLFEVQKYVSLTNHVWDGFFIVVNGGTWRRLPADIRTIVARAFDDAALLQRADIAVANASARAVLESKGMIFNSTDPVPFRQALKKAGFYAEWRAKFGSEAWAVLERHTGHLS
ncbi:MAG: TRAP transporter substrate-binding protein [Rhodospirillaceae bacterium]